MTQPDSGPNGHVYIVSAARTPIGKFGGAWPSELDDDDTIRAWLARRP